MDVQTTTEDSGRWWLSLANDELNALVEEAEARNKGVHANVLAVEQARALFSERRWDAFPRGGVAAGMSRQRLSGPDVDPFGGDVRGPTRELAQADLSATWEIDLFGRNKARRAISEGALDIAGADLLASRALLQAQVVSAWTQWRATSEQMQILGEEIEAAELALSVQQKRVDAGIDDQRSVDGPTALLAERRALRSETEARNAIARSALAVLRGRTPGDDGLLVPDDEPLPIPPSIDSLAGSEGLLIRRPDVVRAKAAYKQSVGAAALASAAFLPELRLDFSGGVLQRPGGLDLSSAGRWAAGGILQWNPLDWARLRAQARAAGAQSEAAFVALEATVLEAVKDAEDRVSDAKASVSMLSQASVTAERTAQSFRVARARHAAGLDGRLALVDAKLAMGETDRALLDAKASSIAAYARAHLALATWQPSHDTGLPMR
jgi:outer membrane protein TolC